MMQHTPLSPLAVKEVGAGTGELRLPTRKEKESLLKRYSRKLGLNDRGCYVAAVLAFLATGLTVIIIAMAACWPGQFSTVHS